MNEASYQFYEKFYVRQHKRANDSREPWQISIDEWMAYWSNSPYFQIKIGQPRSVILQRTDPMQPWSISNLDALLKGAGRKPRAKPVKALRDADIRIITVKEWVSELRQ